MAVAVTVVTGDIVQARRQSKAERAELHRILLDAWQRVQPEFTEELESDFRFRSPSHDDFRFVCRNFEAAMRSLTLLRLHARAAESSAEVALRACIASGTRSLTDHRDPYAQDGSAFHLSREGIERLRRGAARHTLVRFENNCGREELINGLLPLADRIYSGWTGSDASAMLELRDRHPGWSEYEQFIDAVVLLAHHLRSAMTWLVATLNRCRLAA